MHGPERTTRRETFLKMQNYISVSSWLDSKKRTHLEETFVSFCFVLKAGEGTFKNQCSLWTVRQEELLLSS